MSKENNRSVGSSWREVAAKSFDLLNLTPTILPEVLYQQEGIGYFPSLYRLSVKCGFSWGERAGNMKESFEGDDPIKVRERVQAFFRQMRMVLPPWTVCFDPAVKSESDMLEVTEEIISTHEEETRLRPDELPGELSTGANLIYTRLNDISLMVKPADCPVAVLYSPTREGQIVGIAHWGRDQLDRRLAEGGINHLKDQGCDPSDIWVGVTPGIGPENYYVRQENMDLIKDPNLWGVNIKKRGSKYHLDLLGYLIDQLVDAGVDPGNIEAYGVDTYEAAKKGETFSHRYADITGQRKKDGRMIVAVQLK